MSVNTDPNELACPGCGVRNARGICGMRLLNPVGCDETIIVIRCSGCARIYLEVEEDGFSHPEGPDYWTRGPISESEGRSILEWIETCPEPFRKLCPCGSHSSMEDFMYGGFPKGVTTAAIGGEQRSPTAAEPSSGGDDQVPPAAATPSEQDFEAAALELKALAAQTRPGAVVETMIKSMAWARRKFGYKS